MKLRELFSTIEDVAKESRLSTPYVCGGVARDLYMKRIKKISDIDITTGDKDIFILANNIFELYNKKYKIEKKESSDGHISIFFPNIKIDFSSNFIIPGINIPIKNPKPLDLEVYSRDFTCNSLLTDMKMKHLIDITTRGIPDINSKILNTILDPEITLTSNKNRVVRSIYTACNLGFNVSNKIIEFVRENPSAFNNSTRNIVSEKLNAAFKIDSDKAYDLVSKMKLWDIIPINENIKPFYLKYQRENIKKAFNYSEFNNKLKEYQKNIIKRSVLIKVLAGKTIFEDEPQDSTKEKSYIDPVNNSWDNQSDSSVSIGNVYNNSFPLPDADGKTVSAPNQNFDITKDEVPDPVYDELTEEEKAGLTSNINGDLGNYRIQQSKDIGENYIYNKYYGVQDGNKEPLNRNLFFDQKKL